MQVQNKFKYIYKNDFKSFNFALSIMSIMIMKK